jgi:hypothetical protein
MSPILSVIRIVIFSEVIISKVIISKVFISNVIIRIAVVFLPLYIVDPHVKCNGYFKAFFNKLV